MIFVMIVMTVMVMFRLVMMMILMMFMFLVLVVMMSVMTVALVMSTVHNDVVSFMLFVSMNFHVRPMIFEMYFGAIFAGIDSIELRSQHTDQKQKRTQRKD
jgi:hypothetical protein